MLAYTSWRQLLVYICDSWLLYQLLVYSCDSCLISSSMLLSVILQFSCLSCYSVVLYLQLFLLLLCAHCFYARAFPLHTHSPGRFLTTLDLHVQILDALFLLCRCSMRPYASRIAGASPYSILVLLSFKPSYYFLILIISHSVVIPVFIYMISCVVAYMWYCSIHDLLQLDL